MGRAKVQHPQFSTCVDKKLWCKLHCLCVHTRFTLSPLESRSGPNHHWLILEYLPCECLIWRIVNWAQLWGSGGGNPYTYSDSRMLIISHIVLTTLDRLWWCSVCFKRNFFFFFFFFFYWCRGTTLPTIGKCNSDIWTCRSFFGYRVTAAMSGLFT